jgi:hypothetical protein
MTIGFDPEFHCEGVGSILWADEPTFGRVRFVIRSRSLVDVLGSDTPVHTEKNLALVTRERQRVEKACRCAFVSRPAKQVELEAIDFQT